MIYTLPVRLEDGQIFTSLPTNHISFPKVSGYDGNGLRVTNLVGFSNGDFLKKCPNCGRTKCSEAFGPEKLLNATKAIVWIAEVNIK